MPTGGRTARRGALFVAAALALILATGVGLALVAVLLVTVSQQGSDQCSSAVSSSGSGSIGLAAAGAGVRVGATEYGGPGDPSSGTVGASGASLLTHPDSYAELGGYTFQTARAMGGLPYMTPLRISWGRRSAIAFKRDFGFGGGPVASLPRVIDLWWQFAGALSIPYENGQWSGAVRIAHTPGTG